MPKRKKKQRRRSKGGPNVEFLSGTDWEGFVQTVKDAAEEIDDRLTEAASRLEGAAHVGVRGADLEKAATDFLDDEDLQTLLDEFETAATAIVEGARVDTDEDDDDEDEDE